MSVAKIVKARRRFVADTFRAKHGRGATAPELAALISNRPYGGPNDPEERERVRTILREASGAEPTEYEIDEYLRKTEREQKDMLASVRLVNLTAAAGSARRERGR